MSKTEIFEKLNAAADSAYAKSVVELLENTYDDCEKKYGQNTLDRIDDRIGFLKGWEKKHAAEGDAAKAEAEAEKVAALEKLQKAIR